MIHKILLILLLISGAVIIHSAQVQAFDPFPKTAVNCEDPKQSKSSVCNTKNGDPVVDLMLKLTNIVAYIAGIAAIIMIIVSGIRFMTSDGDTSKVSSARSTLTNAVIGLIVIILARTLIVFVIARI